MYSTVTRSFVAACALAFGALITPATAQTQADSDIRAAVAPKTQYIAVAWEGEGYLVTENGGKNWRLVSGDAIASLPEPILRILKQGTKQQEVEATVVPNPATGPVDLRFSVNEPGEVTISLYDLRGAEVLRTTEEAHRKGVQSHRIDVSSLPSGIYHYRLVSITGPVGSGTATVTR